MEKNNFNRLVDPMSPAGENTRNVHARSAVFYTVPEAARLLRVDTATIYRAIREDAFPALRIRTRYVIPAIAVQDLIDRATETGGCVDVAAIAAERRTAREIARLAEGSKRGDRR